MSKRAQNLTFFTELSGSALVDDILAYERLSGRIEKRFASRTMTPDTWRAAGNVISSTGYERGLHLQCEYGWIEVQWIVANCVRVRWAAASDKFSEPFSYAVNKTNWPEIQPEVVENDTSIDIRTSEMRMRIAKKPFRISLETPDGKLICGDKAGMRLRDDGMLRLSMRLQPEESCYGLGERASSLNLRGKRFQLWNTDQPDYERGSDPIYFSIPFYLGLHGDLAYGVFWDNSTRGLVDTGKTEADELLFEAEGGDLRYYLFTGSDINAVIARYTELTGRIPLPPLWALGYQQSRFSYYPQDTVIKLARTFRERGVPCDVIYLDIHYMNGFRVFTWDESRFPDFKAMISELHGLGFKVIAILDPGIKIDTEYPSSHSGFFHDIFLKYPDEETFAAPVWPGMCHFPDFTLPAACEWWAGQCARLIEAGIDGIWNDMGEPTLFTPDGPAAPPDFLVHRPDAGGTMHRDLHNVYGMLMGRASCEALARYRPGMRPVSIIRAGFAGAQRDTLSWTGDNASDWDHLRLSLSMTLNMGLSGFPMTGPDVGGFRGDATPELFTRWLQAASLMPFFRAHTTFGSAQHEPWSFGQPYEVINRLTIELRYRLLPYLYSVIAQCREYGRPVIRPLFMAEPFHPGIRSIDDCYLLGDAILVAPVLEEGAARRKVYLPAGDWYDFWSNDLLEGGEVIDIIAPLERLPLFVRAGAVLPMWPEMQYVGEKTVDTLILRVFPGAFETVMYEDKGEGLEYLNGEYRWVYMTTRQEEDKLIVDRRAAGNYEPSYQTIRLEVIGFHEEPAAVRVDRQGAPVWFFDDDLLELKLETFRTVEITHKPTTSDRTIRRKTW